MPIISDLLDAKRFNVEGPGEGEVWVICPFAVKRTSTVRPKHIVTIDLDHKQMKQMINRCECS